MDLDWIWVPYPDSRMHRRVRFPQRTRRAAKGWELWQSRVRTVLHASSGEVGNVAPLSPLPPERPIRLQILKARVQFKASGSRALSAATLFYASTGMGRQTLLSSVLCRTFLPHPGLL